MQALKKGAVFFTGDYDYFLKIIESDPKESINDYEIILSSEEQKKLIRNQISEKVADHQSLLGTVSDASVYAIDNMVIDILAVDMSTDSSYKKNRIKLFEELFGEGRWIKSVDFSRRWFDGRKTKKIKLPTDIKGLNSVLNDIATRGTGVANILEQAAE